jgi:tetratricopeptide (TPR) repeat protein
MTRSIAILFVFLLLTTGCASIKPPFYGQAFQDELQASEKLVRAEHFRQAIDELTMLLEMDPKNERARFLRALVYQKSDDFLLATQDYQAVIKNNSQAIKAYYNLGMIFTFKINEPRKGLESFDHFLTLAPHHPESFSVAKIMVSLDKAGGELAYEDPYFQGLLGRAMKTSDLSERRKLLSEGSRLKPTSPICDYLAGQSYEMEGKDKEAIRHYQTALAKRPTCANCHRSLSKLLIKQKKNQAGEIHLLKSRLFEPNEKDDRI